MRNFLLAVIIGIVAGIIDILPMIKMKLNKYAIISAFTFYFIMPFIIFNTNLFGLSWWLKGGVITCMLAIPIIIIVSQNDKKSALPIAAMAIVLGTCIGIAGHFFL